MGRPSQPAEIRQRVQDMHSEGQKQRKIATKLNLSRLQVERILFPQRLKNRDRKHRKPNARILKLDREEIPEGYFNVHQKWNWAI